MSSIESSSAPFLLRMEVQALKVAGLEGGGFMTTCKATDPAYCIPRVS